MAAIFDLPVTQMLESVQTSPAAFLDPDNVGVAFRTLLLSCTEDEIIRYFTSTAG